jgi:hypothetical protein
LALSVTASHRVSGTIVVTEFRKAHEAHGIPHSTLTDNGMVFTTRFAGSKGGRNLYEAELHRLGVHQINSTPITPPPAARSNASTKPSKKPSPASPAPRPCPNYKPNSTPSPTNTTTADRTDPCPTAPAASIYTARYKANPATRIDTHNRVRTARVDQAGLITVRTGVRLHHIAIGRTYTGTRVLILIHDLHI